MSELIETQLRAAALNPAQFVGATSVDAGRLAENLAMVYAELDAVPESRLARVLRRLGVPDLTIPLVTATPALRRSWLAAVSIAVLFALALSSDVNASAPDRLAVFLTLAPMVPLLGVALAFGSAVDPTHELVLAAPRDTFRVFLIRVASVLAASVAVLLVGSLLLPTGGALRVAWLVPAIAVTSLSLVLSVGRDARRVAVLVAAAWLVVVVIVSRSLSVSAMFGPVTQLVGAGIALVALPVLWRMRSAIEIESQR